MKLKLNLDNGTIEYLDKKPFIQGYSDTQNIVELYCKDEVDNIKVSYTMADGKSTIALTNRSEEETTLDDENYYLYTFGIPQQVTTTPGQIMITFVVTTSNGVSKFNALNTIIKSSEFESLTEAVSDNVFIQELNAQGEAITELQNTIVKKIGIDTFGSVKVDELPEAGESGILYYVKIENEEVYDVYLWDALTAAFIFLGTTACGLYTQQEGTEFEDEITEEINDFKSDVNDQLDEMTETIEGLGQLQPSGTTTSTNLPTSNQGILIATDNGHWYYWNGTQYADGGVYQTAVNYDAIQDDVFSLTELQVKNYYNLYDSFTPNATSTGYRLNTNKYASSDSNYKVIKFNNFKNDEIFLKCKGYQWQAVEEMIISQARPTNVIGETIVKDVYGVVKKPSNASWLLIMVDVDAVAGDYLVNPITIKQNNHIISRPYFYMVNYTRSSTTGDISNANSKRLTTSGTYFLKKGSIVTTTNEKLIAVYDFGANDTFQSEKYWYNTVYVIPADGYYAFTIKNISETDISYSPEILKIYSDSYNLTDKYNWQDLIDSSFLTYGSFDEVNSNTIAKKDMAGNHKLRVLNNKLLHFNKDNVISTQNTDYSFYIHKINKDSTLEVLCSYSKKYRFLEDCDVIITFRNDNNTSIDLDNLYSNINFYDYYYDSLCIMSYNVQWFSGRNANTIMQNCIIDKYKPDIIGLQEFRGYTPSSSNHSDTSGMPVWDTIFKEYSYKHTTVVGNANYKGLASKIKFDKVYDVAFTNQNIEQRGYSKTYLKINNKNICWINAHIDLDETTKIAQVKELYDLVENEEYFIITGDFNTDYCFSVDDEEYTTIMKQFIDAGYNSANCSEQHGFLGTYCGAPTIDGYNNGIMRPDDHIITSANITINKVFVDTTKTMNIFVDTNNIDHFPLVAFVTID